MTPASNVARLQAAVPFWISLTLVPQIYFSAVWGGWTLLLVPVYGWIVISILDLFGGLDLRNNDPDTPDAQLFWYRAITLIWFPLEFMIVFGGIWWAMGPSGMSVLEKLVLFFGIGVISGTIGINYAHELMHQKSRLERWMGDLLMAMALYGHFRSEHLLVHHRYVGTPRDPVTARYNEGFHRFFPRVLRQCLHSAWKAEAQMLARKGLSRWHRSNPFWRYWAVQGLFLGLAYWIGGWGGVGLFMVQAGTAVWQLELVNYIEHYGLTRKYLGDGKYEHVLPRHSWNSAHRVSNWLLINLQRHSDHHYKPDRRFPLLQNHSKADAPQLPFGYPVMTALAMVPPLWRRFMNPRVRKWRAMYYPEITNWTDYSKAQNPMPRGA